MSNRKFVEKIFKELQNDGCIDKETRLFFENDPSQPGFYTSVNYRVIFVNEYVPIPDDDHIIKYALLHEEGHQRSFRLIFYIKYMPIPITVLFSLMIIGPVIITHLFPNEQIPFLILMVILFFTFFGWFGRSLIRSNEIKADIYSCLCLKEKYHLIPTEILKKDRIFYKNVKPIHEETQTDFATWIKKSYLKSYQWYVSVHPSFAERIEIIRKEVEEKNEYPYINFNF
jgi:hypothetical protein